VGAVLGVVLSRLQQRGLPASDGVASVPGQRAAGQSAEARA